MSFKKIGLAATIVAGASIASNAWGDVESLGYEVVAVDALDVAELGPNWTVKIYANLTTGATLNAMAGNNTQQKTVTTTGSFYQNTFGSSTSAGINCALFEAFPDAAYDSYLTIGCECGDGSPFPTNTVQAVGVDFTSFENGGSLSVQNGTIFAIPGAASGVPQPYNAAGCNSGQRDGVLIAQLTVVGGAGSSLTFDALFQGRGSDGVTNWQGSSSITVVRPSPPADCNGNGVDDACDIENNDSQDANNDGIPDECADCNDNGTVDNDDIAAGTSTDCNSNGIPDECDLADDGPDCNANGLLDACDIANGAADCNNNGIPDSCEIDAGASDCDGNGVLDSCELANGAADCNTNGIIDSCDIASGTSEDCDGDGIPDECETDTDGDGTIDDCEYVAYRNVETGAEFTVFDDASYASQNGDRIEADFEAINAETDVDFRGKSLRVSVINGDYTQAADASLNLGSGSLLQGGSVVTLDGSVRTTGSYAIVSATTNMSIGADGSVTVRGNSDLEFEAPAMTNSGEITIRDSANLDLNLVNVFTNNGDMNMIGTATMHAESFTNNGNMSTSGTLYLTLDNEGSCQLTANTVLTGNLNNAGLTSAVAGQLYVLGNISNTGQLVGNVGEGFRNSGGHLKVSGSFAAGADSSLILPDGWQITVGSHFDIEINESSNLIALDASVRMNRGLSASSTIEAMSEDRGEILEAIAADNFAIGTLTIGAGNTVTVVDNHVNSGSSDEVLYVRNLVVESGATLDANGKTVWAENLVVNGTIVGDIIEIDPVTPCPGDTDDNRVVNIEDLLVVLASFSFNAGGDLNGDLVTNIDDLLIVLGNYGTVCE